MHCRQRHKTTAATRRVILYRLSWIERNVVEQLGRRFITLRDSLQVFQVAATSLHIVVLILQQWFVETKNGRQLFARGLAFEHRDEHTRETQQFRFVSSASREANKFLEQIGFSSRRATLSLFDAEMLEYLVDSGVTNVIDQFQRAKPRKRVGRLHDHPQKRERVLDVRRFCKPDPAKLPERNALFAELDLEIKRM